MTRALWTAVIGALTGCAPNHVVTLDLGVTGDPDRLPAGFACKRDNGRLMMEDALDGNRFTLSLVVDFLDMRGGIPMCRGDAISRWCTEHGGCRPIELASGVRYCTEMRLTFDPGDPVAAAAAFNRALSGAVVIDDAPDRALMVRVVGTTQPCSEVERWTGTGYPAYAPAKTLGCEYSCPVFLDEVDQLAISLDTFDQNCEAQVLACGAGP